MNGLLLCAMLMTDGPVPQNFAFEDQFDAKPALADLRGKVAVLVYADRRGVEAGKAFGEQLHLAFHPTAKGLPPGKARQQPAAGVPGVANPPGVAVQAVACVGKAPGLVRAVLKNRIQAAAPDVPVWLDFDGHMAGKFGLTGGEVNVAVFDPQGVYRYGFTGTPDEAKRQEPVRTVQGLRAEGK